MIKIVSKLMVKEECIEAFKAQAQEIVEKSQAEEANVTYTLNQSIQNPCLFAFIEIWKDQEAINIHNASEHFNTILPKLAAMTSEPQPVDLFTEVNWD